MKDHSDFKITGKRKLDSLIDALSFGENVQRLVEIINTDTSSPLPKDFCPISHPAGFYSLINRRRLTIAQAYIRLLANSDSPDFNDRIEALRTLLHYIRYSENVDMPVNTARVQIALLKNAVQMHGNRHAQLRLMNDFSLAYSGKGRIIRKHLRELDLIEIPESDNPLAEKILAWDDHLQFALTDDHRSATQLVLSAFIKGLSRVTISYYCFKKSTPIDETLTAGRILGIRTQIAIRFSVGKAHQRRTYLFIPPQITTPRDFWDFFDQNKEKLSLFETGLEENAKRRSAVIRSLIQKFNDEVIPEFNAPYADIESLQMPPLNWENIEKTTQGGQVNRIHLGIVIFKAMRPIALKRMLLLKNRYRMQPEGSEEARLCLERYEDAKAAYQKLTPSYCAQTFISPESETDYDSAFLSEDEILPMLRETGGYTAFVKPLQHGLTNACEVIFRHYRHLTDIEVYNMLDAKKQGVESYTSMAHLIGALHRGDEAGVQRFIEENGIAKHSPEEIREICEYFKSRPFYTRCASDSLGWLSQIPGKGFFQEYSLSSGAFKVLSKSEHQPLPQPIADLICTHRPTDSEKKRVFNLSSMTDNGEWVNGHLVQLKRMSPADFWRYMNVDARCFIKTLIGFIPAFLFLDPWWFALVWFFITAFRNAIVDLLASSGIGPKHWALKSIDRENLCTSLLFTGFSVPIMAAAKAGFDAFWINTLSLDTDFIYTFIKFWVIALANGLYLATHNTIRGFDKAAVRGNFFRSVLSWPLATAASYILTPLGVPDIVQAKLASEVVAGVIEGTVKHRKKKNQTVKALADVYQQILSTSPVNALMAKLDILYFWDRFSFGKMALESFLLSPEKLPHSCEIPAEEIEKGNADIVEFFQKPNALENLTEGILKHYPEEHLQVLTELAGNTCGAFTDWLRHKKL